MTLAAGATAGVMAVACAMAMPATANADSNRVTSMASLNVRSGPAMSARIIGGLYRGQTITADGPSVNGWTPVRFNGKRAWVSSKYVRPLGSPAPAWTAGQSMVTTAAINLRTGPGTKHHITTVLRKGTQVRTTGTVSNGFAQVRWGSSNRWVSAKYLKSASAATRPSATSNDNSNPKPPPGTGLNRLQPSTKRLLGEVRTRYPQIPWYGGARAGGVSDHTTGRALDIMLGKDYSSAGKQKLGRDIAEWAKNNAGRLGVEYVIYNQRIYNVKRAKEGWRPMAGRGSDNANHKNHVHVSMLK